MKKKIKIENFEKIVKIDQFGKYFIWKNLESQKEKNLKEISDKLISRGSVLSDEQLIYSSGMSCVLAVLNGFSGCHLHSRSDYISWNLLGGAFHNLRDPIKFETNLGDSMIVPKNMVHILTSNQNQPNTMLLFQFPGQNSSDRLNATGCSTFN